MRIIKFILVTLAVSFSLQVNAAIIIAADGTEIDSDTVKGTITNITSVDSGILVRIGADHKPVNCTIGTSWMEIKQEKTAMTALTLAAWTMGRKVTIYASGSAGSYCQVYQVHPVAP